MKDEDFMPLGMHIPTHGEYKKSLEMLHDRQVKRESRKLAILIPTTPDRQRLLDRLTKELDRQRAGHDCIVIINETESAKDGGPTTGAKRNQLLDAAREQNASHIAFIDSDDLVSPRYIEAVMPAVLGDYDCCELYGRIYFHNKPGNIFHHSIEYKEWFQTDKMYMRMPNHLNCVKLDHYKGITFQDKTVGEDFWASEDLRKTGRLVNQYPIKEVTYHYFNGNKNHKLEPSLVIQTGTSIY
jgi:hypothetical protein